MSTIDLKTLLQLVGTLDDSADPNSPSARFRTYIRENVQGVSELRAYVEEALSTSGDQYNKALQDLINHAGQLLGFEVAFGRYRGVQGEIGFDGLWHSPTGRALVVEAKTTDVYTVRTSTLLGYINRLVSDGQIKHSKKALGLYVYGRFDADSNQLENAIIAEGRQDQLRVMSVDALLNLLELQQEYELDHETVLPLLFPPPVRVDTLVNLIFDIASQERRQVVAETAPIYQTRDVEAEVATATATTTTTNYYLLPASDSEDGMSVLENLHHWLGRGMWGLGQRTGYRKAFQPGDRACFYAARIGMVAECTIASPSFELDRKQSPKPHLEVPYAIRLENVRWFDDTPIALSREVRAELSGFQGRDLGKGWAWIVQGTSKLTLRDHKVLTGRRTPGEKDG